MKIKKLITMLLATLLAVNNITVTFAKEMILLQKEKAESSFEGLDFDSEKKSYVQFDQAFEEMPKTLELRMKIDAGNTKRQVLMGNYVSGKNCFSLELTTENKLRYVEYVYAGGKMITGIDLKVNDVEVATGEWMLLSLVRDTDHNKLSLYKDGSLVHEHVASGVGSDTLQSSATLSTAHYLGTDARKQFFLDGEIAEVRLWNESKDQEAIRAGMNVELTGEEVGLQHAYDLDMQALTTANRKIKDKTANGISCTANGFVLPDAPVYEKQGTDFSANDKDLEMIALPEEIPMTFETWVKIDPDKVGTRSVLMGNYYDSYYDGIPLLNFEITAKGEPRLYWNINKIATDYKATGINVYTGSWTHIAISVTQDPKASNNQIFSTYINGELVHSQSMVFTPVNITQPMKIGEDSRFAHYMKGSMADLRIWSTSRTAQEIKDHFNLIVKKDEQGLLGNWLLDEEVQGRYVDRSPHGNDAAAYWLDKDLFQKAEDGYETIAIIPDTQTMTYWAPDSFTTMTTWLKNHAEELGIKLAIHLGDIVNDNGDQKQWNQAKSSMHVLDGVIPYVFSAGNHDTAIQKVDGKWWGKRDTTMMNKNFPYATYAQEESFGGAYEEGAMDNTYSYFTINEVDFMTISLEQNPRDEVLEWANQIVEANADKKVIITTHEYMYYDGKPTTENAQDHLKFIGGSNPGVKLWEKFGKKHENIVAIFSGHVGYPDILMEEAVGDHGNTVQQVLCDAQFMDRDDVNNGSKKGLGMVMLLSFKEGSNDIHINWYSTVREQFFRTNNQFTSQLQLQKAVESEAKTLLDHSIMKAEMFINSDEFKTLAPNVKAMLQVRLEEAKAIYEDPSASDEACLLAWKNLADAMHYAGFQADKTMLKALIEECVLIDTSNYAEGVSTFEEALEKAKDVYQDIDVLQESIDAAYDALTAAKDNLKEQSVIEVDKRLLNSVIDLVKQIEKDQYVQNDAWNILEAALQEAEKVLVDEQVNQAIVNQAVSNLLDAYENIRLLPSEALLKQLENFLDMTSKINRSLFTTSELVMIDETIHMAKEMLDQKDFDLAMFQSFASNMDEVKALINQKEQTTSTVRPNENVVTNANNKQDYKKGLHTGDTTDLAGLTGLLVIAAGAIVFSKRRVKNEEEKS